MPIFNPPAVLDLSHHNTGSRGDAPINFDAIKEFGVQGVILKSSQGLHMVDQKFQERVVSARAAGLRVGAYHFCTGDDVDDQIKHFLDTAQPDAQMLMALDHEPNVADPSNILDLDGIHAALESGKGQLGRGMKLYSGNLIKEQTAKDDSHNDFLGDIPLWLSQYGQHAVLPDPWENYWLWQFAGDGTNNHGIVIPGIYNGGSVDMNAFDGTAEELAASWV